MKKIIISCDPKSTELILSGEKTLDVRSYIPSCELPCEVYIYSTKFKSGNSCIVTKDLEYELEQKVTNKELIHNAVNGQIVAKFILDKIDTYYANGGYGLNCMTAEPIVKASRIPEWKLYEYNNYNRKTLYGWHISNLQILSPMSLEAVGLAQAPKTWCFIKKCKNN